MVNTGEEKKPKKRFKVVFSLPYDLDADDAAKALEEAITRFNDDVETAILKHGEAPSNFFGNKVEEVP